MIRWNSYNSDTRTQTNSISKDTPMVFFSFYKKEMLVSKASQSAFTIPEYRSDRP